MTEEKLIKKEIFSYTIFIAIIALICIFKNEIWEFVKFIFSNLDFICGNCRRKNKISIWKNKTSIKVEILFFYKP